VVHALERSTESDIGSGVLCALLTCFCAGRFKIKSSQPGFLGAGRFRKKQVTASWKVSA